MPIDVLSSAQPILVKLVAAANHIDDPDEITVGQIIFFPSLWP